MYQKAKTMKKKVKKAKAVKAVLAVMGSILFLSVLLAVLIKERDTANVYGYVNGLPFYEEEFLLYEEKNRAYIAGMISGKYGLSEVGDDFWSMDFDGLTPKEILRNQALECLLKDKVIQQEAIKRGITAPADFKELRKSMEGQKKVYGPKDPSILELSRYLTELASDDLKGLLLKTELKPTEEDLQKAFDSLPKEIKEKDFLSLGHLFRWMDTENDMAGKILEELEKGSSPEEIVSNFIALCENLKTEEFSLDTRYIHREDTASYELSAWLFEVAQGESWLMSNDREQTLYYITKKEGGGYYTYEEAPKLGENKWINDQFENFIEQKIEEAEVELKLP